MKTGKYRIVAHFAALLMLTACVTDRPDERPKGKAGSDLTKIDQVQSEGADPYPPELFQVEQISKNNTRPDYTFADVEGDDPCLAEENRGLAQCKTALGNGSAGHAARPDGTAQNALSELQAITPNIIDPETFDADRTADEIGRPDGHPRSQVGMAVGADFLAPPPPPPEPEQPEPELERALPPIPHLPDGPS